jgi:2-oxoglutarate ferredoxin oxidoreductase subunit alpha
MARAAGLRAGLFRPITLWPFPRDQMAALARRRIPIVMAEINLGQYAGEVERHIGRPVHGITHGGGALLTPDAILAGIQAAARV